MIKRTQDGGIHNNDDAINIGDSNNGDGNDDDDDDREND